MRLDLKIKDDEIHMKDKEIAPLPVATILVGAKDKEPYCISKSKWDTLPQDIAHDPKHEIASLKDKVASRDGQIAQLKQTLALRLKVLNDTVVFHDIKMKQNEIEAKDEQIAARDKRIISNMKEYEMKESRLQQKMRLYRAKKNTELALKDDEIASKDIDIARLKDELASKDKEINGETMSHPPSKRQRTDQHQPKALTVQLGPEHTSCSICHSKYSTDLNNRDDNIKKHLPVISASSKTCDHFFCHGCVLKQQAAIAEKNDRKVSKWIPCMICRTKTAFCPSEPKYHWMLIDILKEANWTDRAQVKEEPVD